MKNFNLKTALFALVTSTTIFSCQQIGDADTINTEMTALMKEEKCLLSWTDQTSSKDRKFIIDMQSKLINDFVPGKVIFSAYQRLKAKGIKPGVFEIKSGNQQYYSIKFKNLASVEKKLEVFEKHFGLLLDNKKEELLAQSIPAVRNGADTAQWFNNMTQSMASNKKSWKFSGFILNENEGVRYLVLGKEIENDVIVYLSYKVGENDNLDDHQIYGVGYVPYRAK